MVHTITWNEIRSPLREGSQTLTIRTVNTYINGKRHRCILLLLQNAHGEEQSLGLSIEPEHRGFLEGLLDELGLDFWEIWEEDCWDRLQGKSFDAEVMRDQWGRVMIDRLS